MVVPSQRLFSREAYADDKDGSLRDAILVDGLMFLDFEAHFGRVSRVSAKAGFVALTAVEEISG